MAKGNDAAAMDIDGQKSAASEQITNPKFSINGASLSFYMKEFVYVIYIDVFSYLLGEFRSAAAFEISSNAAWIALRWLRSLQV